jgi:hypothetical protein
MPGKRHPTVKASKPTRNGNERVRQELETESPPLVGSQNQIEPSSQNPESCQQPEGGEPDTRLSVTPDNQAIAKQSPGEHVDDPPKLTTKERRFVDAYERLGYTDLLRAAKRAGIASQTRSATYERCRTILDKPAVRAEIDRRLRSEAVGNTELISLIGGVAKFDPAVLGTLYVDSPNGRRFDWTRARQLGVSRYVKHVALDRSGNETAEWLDVHRARELLAKVSGLTSDATNVQVNIDTMSIDELKAIISG